MPILINPTARIYLDTDGWRDVTARCAMVRIESFRESFRFADGIDIDGLLSETAHLLYTPTATDPVPRLQQCVKLATPHHTYRGFITAVQAGIDTALQVECSVR